MIRAIGYSLITILVVGLLYRVLIGLSGGTVTSWWRTPWRNAELGGKPWSLHQLGLAWDVVPVTASMQSRLKALPLLHIVNEGTHLHAQLL